MKNYKNKDFVLSHVTQDHAKDAFTRFLCEDCNRTFSSYQSYKIHRKAAHSEAGLERFKCTGCPQTFTKIPPLKNHFNRVHKGEVLDVDAIQVLFL